VSQRRLGKLEKKEKTRIGMEREENAHFNGIIGASD